MPQLIHYQSAPRRRSACDRPMSLYHKATADLSAVTCVKCLAATGVIPSTTQEEKGGGT